MSWKHPVQRITNRVIRHESVNSNITITVQSRLGFRLGYWGATPSTVKNKRRKRRKKTKEKGKEEKRKNCFKYKV